MSKKPTIEELEIRIAELTDALQRERADAMNVRRRAEEDRAKLGAMHKASVVKELLPVIDNFERSLKYVPEELESNEYIKGIGSILRQFEEIIENIGVHRIKTVGEPFDPNLHDAVSHQESEGEELVTEELQSGYMIDGEVIRHAMVRVN